jgi:hypothetical protein
MRSFLRLDFWGTDAPSLSGVGREWSGISRVIVRDDDVG